MTAIQDSTLRQIYSLARLYQTGYRSATVDTAIHKLVSMGREQLLREKQELEAQLKSFEMRYGLSSEEFHRRFEAGEMGDDADMFEWDAFYRMWSSVEKQLNALES